MYDQGRNADVMLTILSLVLLCLRSCFFRGHLANRWDDMVGPNGLEPSTSSVSRKRSNQTELRAYMRMAVAILTGDLD